MHKAAGYPIQGEKGEETKCQEKGIMNSLCSAGADNTCNGSYSHGFCEPYDIKDQGHWLHASKFGQYMSCRQGAISAVCTSGSSKDCNDGKSAHSIFCNTSMRVNKKRGHCKYRAQKTDNGLVRCRKGQVIVGKAASGGSAHAHMKGHKVFGWIKCCDSATKRAIEPEE
jgi:hypothetical protein